MIDDIYYIYFEKHAGGAFLIYNMSAADKMRMQVR